MMVRIGELRGVSVIRRSPHSMHVLNGLFCTHSAINIFFLQQSIL